MAERTFQRMQQKYNNSSSAAASMQPAKSIAPMQLILVLMAIAAIVVLVRYQVFGDGIGSLVSDWRSAEPVMAAEPIVLPTVPQAEIPTAIEPTATPIAPTPAATQQHLVIPTPFTPTNGTAADDVRFVLQIGGQRYCSPSGMTEDALLEWVTIFAQRPANRTAYICQGGNRD